MCLFRKRKEYKKFEAQKFGGQLGCDLEHSHLAQKINIIGTVLCPPYIPSWRGHG
jgi:hypothetical protein